MKNKFLAILASAALTFSATSFATETVDGKTPTIMESLRELKDSIKETAKAGVEKFNEKAASVYNSLSTQIDEMFHASKDKKDAKIEALKKERDELKEAMERYKEANDAESEATRQNLVEKLETLNQKINDYKDSIKK